VSSCGSHPSKGLDDGFRLHPSLVDRHDARAGASLGHARGSQLSPFASLCITSRPFYRALYISPMLHAVSVLSTSVKGKWASKSQRVAACQAQGADAQRLKECSFLLPAFGSGGGPSSTKLPTSGLTHPLRPTEPE